MSDQVKQKPLYELILEKGKDALKGVTDILARKKDKRAFKSGYDKALELEDSASTTLAKLYEDIGKYSDNMEKITGAGNDLRKAQITKEFLLKESKRLFGDDFDIARED